MRNLLKISTLFLTLCYASEVKIFYFYERGCKWCVYMDDVLNDSSIQNILKRNTDIVKVNIHGSVITEGKLTETEFARKYSIKAVPTLIFLNTRGLVVSDVFYIGEMLQRTGRDIGRTKRVFNKAWVMEFCSASLSRDMFEKNPHFIAFCPYKINVYTLPEDGKKVYLSYRRLIWDESGKDVLRPVERLLEDIINDVIRIQKEYQ